MKPTDPSLLWSSTLRRSTIRFLLPVGFRLGEFATLLQRHTAVAGAQLVDTGIDAPVLDHPGDAAARDPQGQVAAQGLEERPAILWKAFLSHVRHNNNTPEAIPRLQKAQKALPV